MGSFLLITIKANNNNNNKNRVSIMSFMIIIKTNIANTMKKQILVELIIITIMFMGCKNNRNDIASKSDNIFEYDFNENVKNIHDIDLISNVEILSLECSELIGNIDKIDKFDKRIFVMDRSKEKCIYIFNSNGKYINKISRFGNGPEEYLQLSDFFINEEDSTLNILTRIDKKLFKYDLDGKGLLSIIKMPKAFSSMAKTNYGYIAYSRDYIEDYKEPFNLWYLSDKYKIVHGTFKINKDIKSSSIEGSVFSSYHGKVNYNNAYDYNIYEIGKGNETVKYRFDINSTHTPKKSKNNNIQSLEIDRIRNFQETENNIIIRVLYNGEYLLGVYNKKSSTSNVVSLKPYEGEYFFSFGDFISINDHTIFTVIDAFKMKKYWNGFDDYNNFEEKYPQQIMNLRSKFKAIDEEGNPFLIMYSIK